MTLKQYYEAVDSAGKAKDEARERWTALLSAGDLAHVEARRKHLALDEEYEARVIALTSALCDIREDGMLDLELAELGEDLMLALRRLASERGFRELLEPVRINDLETLITTWRKAAATLDATQRLNTVRMMSEPETFDDAVEEERDSYRDEEAWERALTLYRKILAGVQTELELAERMSEAAYAAISRARKHYDTLSEQVQSVLEDLNERGMLDYALADLEPWLRRVVYDAISGGLIRQRQRQTQTRPEARPVALAEPDLEADPEVDY